MDSALVRRAVAAARAAAVACGLRADNAVVVHNSDRIAVRLLPDDVLARVAPAAWVAGMEQEADVSRRLVESGSPIGDLAPGAPPEVVVRDGFAITLWTFYERIVDRHGALVPLAPAVYADALARLHAGLRRIDRPVPHFSARLGEWATAVDDRDRTPELHDAGRALLHDTFQRVRDHVTGRALTEQLLHGEPHEHNVLNTAGGPRFIDVTCAHGPVEYDLAFTPDGVAEHYPGADMGLVRVFRTMSWAGMATMRWYPEDQFPDREHWRHESLRLVRAALDRIR